MVENNVWNTTYLCINFNEVQGTYITSESYISYSFIKIILKGKHLNINLKVIILCTIIGFWKQFPEITALYGDHTHTQSKTISDSISFENKEK